MLLLLGPVQPNAIVRCREFPPFEHGDEVEYEGDFSPGTIARFYCEVEHDLFGPSLSECLANGEWNESAPECLRK